jgi:hypothetical protein
VFSTTSDICTQAHSYPKQATYKKSQAIKLACKSYTQDTLLLNFKITQKAFGFKPDSNNQSCRAKLLEHNKTGLTIFGFSTISYEFSKLAGLRWGVLIFHRKAHGKI